MDKLKMEATKKSANPQPVAAKAEPQDTEDERDDRDLLVEQILAGRLFE